MKFNTAVQPLVESEVEFIIIGGWSAVLHGSSTLTNDLDIFFPASRGEYSPASCRLAAIPPFALATVAGDIDLLDRGKRAGLLR